jgi:hypothetical protein
MANPGARELVVSLAFLAVLPDVAGARPSCPEPTRRRGGACVLNADADLAALGTVELRPDTHLDCRGHRLYTSRPGTSIADRSQPEVGLFLHQAPGVKIENCVLEGFDFPIFAMDAKQRFGRPIRVAGNTIVGRYTAVTLLSVDRARIEDNLIRYTTAGGLGVGVLRDSDGVQVRDNTIEPALGPDATGVTKQPGPILPSNPVDASGTGGVYISQGTGMPTLLSAIVNGRLYQSRVVEDPATNASFPEATLIEGNTITGTLRQNDVSVSSALRPLIFGNLLGPARLAILFGAANHDVDVQLPGTCADGARACLGHDDCFIPGVDEASHGACALPARTRVFWLTQNPVIAGNTLRGPFDGGIQVAAPGTLIHGNDIAGPVTPGISIRSFAGAGIELRRFSAERALVAGNKVTDLPIGLRLFNVPRYFGARVFLNQFLTPYPVVADRELPAELSVGVCSAAWWRACSRVAGGTDDPATSEDESAEECAAAGAGECVGRVGNHWGLTCEQSGGFDESRVLTLTTGTVSPTGEVTIAGNVIGSIHDGAPLGAPATWDELTICE